MCDTPNSQAALENEGIFQPPGCHCVLWSQAQGGRVERDPRGHFGPVTSSYSGGWESPRPKSDSFVAAQSGSGSFQHPRLLAIIPVIRITSVENSEES